MSDQPTPDLPTLVFADQVEARTTRVHISHTYGQYLECSPCPFNNQKLLERIPDQAKHVFGRAPVVIVPVDPALVDPDEAHLYRVRPMPRFQMMAAFKSNSTRNPTDDFTFLTLVWHQDTPFPFVDEAAAIRIASIRWFRHAAHGSY